MRAKKAKLLRKVAKSLSPVKGTEYVPNSGEWPIPLLLQPNCSRAIYQRLKKNVQLRG